MPVCTLQHGLFVSMVYLTNLFLCFAFSLAVEPLYPQLCQASPSFEIPHLQNGPSPVEVSRRLNSLPCSLSFHRDELSSLLQLILEVKPIFY